jgi:hypothetical protein
MRNSVLVGAVDAYVTLAIGPLRVTVVAARSLFKRLRRLIRFMFSPVSDEDRVRSSLETNARRTNQEKMRFYAFGKWIAFHLNPASGEGGAADVLS